MKSQYVVDSGTITLTASSTAASDFTINNIPFRIGVIRLTGYYYNDNSTVKTGGTTIFYVDYDGVVTNGGNTGNLAFVPTVTQSNTSSSVSFAVDQQPARSSPSNGSTTVSCFFESLDYMPS